MKPARQDDIVYLQENEAPEADGAELTDHLSMPAEMAPDPASEMPGPPVMPEADPLHGIAAQIVPTPRQLPEQVPVEDTPLETTDPLVAITETTERATEAATEFVGWIGSGERDALIALALVVGFTTALWFVRWFSLKGIVQLPRADDYSMLALFQRMIRRFHIYFMVAIALKLTDLIWPLPAAVSGFSNIFFILAAVLQIAEWAQEFFVSYIRRSVHRNAGDAKALASAFNVIKWFISAAIWSVALLLILDNVGADVTALLAGLGIGGIAIGIAAQGIFRDLFSSISIVMDKPFQVGDNVRYGESWGTIEDIGLKTTRIRARSGEQIIISNTNLLDFEIHNMQRMARRRVETEFGVIYQTPPDVADRIPGMVAELVKTVQGVDFDRCSLSSFGPSSLDYDLVFYSLNPDFNRSMAARSRVLLALFRLFKEEGIEFAYPTQTLHIEGMHEPSAQQTLKVLKSGA